MLRAAGRITGEKRFVIIGSQSLHGKHPDLADEIVRSPEVELIATKSPGRSELLNEIGVDSPFHQSFGYYADPIDITTAVLPRGWRGRLVHLPPGDTDGVKGLCLGRTIWRSPSTSRAADCFRANACWPCSIARR